MKREKREMDVCEDAAMGKGKMMMMEEEQDAGMDELLAALGYKVRSSDMADVAEKLEQLDMVMMGGPGSAAPDDGLLSRLASDTTHYNPSDLYSWLDSMLSEVNAPLPAAVQDAQLSPPPQIYNHSFESGASAKSSTVTTVEPLSGGGSQPSVEVGMSRDRKRMRASSSSSSSRGVGTVGVESVLSAASTTEVSSMPIVVADSQDAGIRLVQALMACAVSVQQENFTAADALVKQISVLATSQAGAMRKVAGYFAEALARRIYRLNPQQDCSLDSAFSDILQMHFYESCPYLKFAHFTANQAILEAFAGHGRVHVIDFGMMQGMQWPALMQALALRPGGPPSFRLTGIGPPQPDNTDALQQVGWKLAQLADTIGIEFEYRGLVAGSLADLEPYMLELAPSAKGEETETEPAAVAVNSVLELHRLLNRQGAIEKVLATVRAVRPKIVTVVEQEANHNADRFVDRFTEALHYYSTMFDSLEGGGGEQQDQMMSEVYLGRQICNVLACEAADRTERHETLVQWRSRMERAGFDPVHLGSNAFRQAGTLLAFFARGDGFRVEENEGCLTLGWHTRPLIATSAWRCSATAGGAAAMG